MNSEILNKIRPNSEWILRGNDLIWLDNNQSLPTETEIQAAEQLLIVEKAEKHIKDLVQAHLDLTAFKWGYDNIYTAITYVGDIDPTYNKEGQMFKNWRSAVWVYVNEELAKLQQGLRTMPTKVEAIAELPLLDTFKAQQGL